MRARAASWAARVPLTGLGWAVLAGAVGAFAVAGPLDWAEFGAVGAAGACGLLVGLLWTVGRSGAEVDLVLERPRVTVGAPARCLLEVRGGSVEVDLPIGGVTRVVEAPAAPQGYRESLGIPTDRRGVIAIGPAVVVRRDPVGLIRRPLGSTERRELFVHPVTAALGPLATGLLRDLEGYQTPDLAVSDLAFHALREYAPGDDRRHIHWRSSAKLAAAGTEAKFLVRQFLQTRRARLSVLVDCSPDAYADPADFEIALSAAGSVIKRADQDEIDTALIAGDRVALPATATTGLDTLSRAHYVDVRPADLVARSLRLVPDATVVLVVTGAHRSVADLRGVAGRFGADVRVVGLIVDPAARPAVRRVGAFTSLTISELADLRAVAEGVALG